jgi:hypothetical protein
MFTTYHSSQNTVRMIKSRRVRWAGHTACMGRSEIITKFWFGGLNGRDQSEDLTADGRIILKRMIGK